MLSVVVIFMLLFNLTCTSTQEVLSKTQIFHDSFPMSGENPKSKNIGTSSSNFSTSKIYDKQNNNASAGKPTVLNLITDPFSGNDYHSGVERQIGKNNEDVHQNQEKSDNEKSPNEISLHEQEAAKDSSKEKVVVPSNNNNNNNPPKQIKSNVTSNGNKNFDKSSTLNPVRINSKEDIIQSGALLRGFYVFVGLSVMIMVYLLFRSYRLRHGMQLSTTVRKYGVTARRSDMEMRPLELEDDDDDTVFEIGNPSVNR